MGRRRARRGPAADVRVHLLGREQRRRPVPRQRGAAARAGAAVPARPHAAARRGGRRAARRSACSSRRRSLAFAPAVGLALLLCAAWRGRAERGSRDAGGRSAGGRGGRRRRRSPSTACSARRSGTARWSTGSAGVVAARSADVRPWQLDGAAELPLAALPARARRTSTTCSPACPRTTLWFKGLVGHFGWLDYELPALGLPRGRRALPGPRGARRARALWQRRAALRAHAGELLVFAAFGGGPARGDRGRGLPRRCSTAAPRLRAGALPAAAARRCSRSSLRSPCGRARAPLRAPVVAIADRHRRDRRTACSPSCITLMRFYG